MIGLLVPGTYSEIMDGIEVIKRISFLENGYYEQAEKIVKLPLILITSLNVIMRSRISYYYSLGKIEDIKSIINKSISFSMCFSIPISIGMISVAKMLVPIYLGPGYDKCIILMYILSPLVVIISISNLLGTHYYTPFCKQRTSNQFLIVGAIVNLFLNFILIKFFYSIGAAIASIIAEVVVTTLYVSNARTMVSPLLFLKLSIKYILSGLIMFLLLFILNYFLQISIVNLIILVLSGIFIYFAVLLILRDAFFVNTIKTIFNKLMGKGK
jgi:O-antigen/teichoic acid export membrane protein